MKRMLIGLGCFLLSVILAIPVYADTVLAEIEYFYSDDGTLVGKAFNGKRVHFEYDLRGQLLAVKDAYGKDLERYTYDPAGNRLSKTINGVTTAYTYDKANQLVTSTVNGVTTHYKYDAAGRMIQAGDKKYIYNGNNKVVAIWQNGDIIAKFEYNIDGQIAKAIYGDKVEEFMWDGLALIWRSGVTYINEPYVTGGNPVMAGDNVLFNDMLGNTLAVNGNPVEMTSFGETADKNAFFTGKPMVDELGYSFLFRDYNPNHGKWTTSDPLGYPDGWNNLAYVNNGVIEAFDWLGGWTYIFKGVWTRDELVIFENRMAAAFKAIQSTASELKQIYNEHKSHNCACPIHTHCAGLFQLISILDDAIKQYKGSDALRIIKEDLGNNAGAYSASLLHLSAYMKINIKKESAYNFFTGLAASTIRTCIHEISHAGGSKDYMDENNAPKQYWDNAYIIEDIGTLGINAFKNIVDLNKCQCE